MTFLPKDYKVPEVDGNYLRLQQGENQFRILSEAITGWELWIDNKPVRFKEEDGVPVEMQEKADVDKATGEPRLARHFIAFIIWNRNAKPKPKLQIAEFTQGTIKKPLNALNRSKAWGDPTGTDGYDILIEKDGEGFDTTYSVTPAPKEKLDKEIIEAYKKAYIKLEALFDGEDPFKTEITDKDLEEVEK